MCYCSNTKKLPMTLYSFGPLKVDKDKIEKDSDHNLVVFVLTNTSWAFSKDFIIVLLDASCLMTVNPSFIQGTEDTRSMQPCRGQGPVFSPLDFL